MKTNQLQKWDSISQELLEVLTEQLAQKQVLIGVYNSIEINGRTFKILIQEEGE